jgi:hypothetical protein
MRNGERATANAQRRTRNGERATANAQRRTRSGKSPISNRKSENFLPPCNPFITRWVLGLRIKDYSHLQIWASPILRFFNAQICNVE